MSTPAAATTAVYGGSGFAIQDLQTQTSTIIVTDAQSVASVDFVLSGLSHPFLSDLTGSITHNGKTVSFLTGTGSNADLNGTYLISDAGTVTLGAAAGSPRAPGVYAASDVLSAFAGESAAGSWTLAISDTSVGDIGNLANWSLALVTDGSYAGAGFAIDDHQSRSSTITLTDAGQISDVVFSLDRLEHSSIGDLSGTLSHDGVSVTFLTGSSATSDLNGTYVISDDGVTTLDGSAGNPRGSGLYSASDLLSAFDGLSAAGDWTLTISDDVDFDEGSLGAWHLDVLTASVPEASTWSMMLLGFSGLGIALRTRRQTGAERASFL